ncbi:hypothetical protein BC833DRAFT_439010, partial [Globomyces pollinis-pini]
HSHSNLVDIKKWNGYSSLDNLFETLLVYQNYPPGTVEENKLPFTLSYVDHFDSVEYPLCLIAVNDDSKLSFNLKFLPKRITEDSVMKIGERLKGIYYLLIEDDIESVLDAVSLSPSERQHILHMGTGEVVKPNNDLKFFESGNLDCIHTLIDFERFNEKIAIKESLGVKQISYRNLDIMSNRIAQKLISLGVGPGHVICLVTERSIEMVIGILGIVKAGAAYAPVDASLPLERLSFILEDTKSTIVVTSHNSLLSLVGHSRTSVCVEDTALDVTISEAPPVQSCNGENLLYVVYTSGTTGKPKGVQFVHKSFTNMLINNMDIWIKNPISSISQFQSIGFDMCVMEVFISLFSGATLVIRDLNDPLAVLSQVDTVIATPAAILHLDDISQYSNVRNLILAGEPCPQTVPDMWLDPNVQGSKGRRIVNAYGPSETHISHAAILEFKKAVNIGRQIRNIRTYLVDKFENLVPLGVAGELFIGGAGVARGYLNRQDLTSERFVLDKFINDGSFLYKTGDICRWNMSGELEILGRRDDMVKVKGYRVELNEIVLAIVRNPSVTGAAVIVKDDILVAFVTPLDASINSIRDTLSDILPPYMIPSVFSTLEVFPVTQNGKIDKRQLASKKLDHTAFEKPVTELEKGLAMIWSELLKVSLDQIGRHTSFFELGGDSISAIKLVSRASSIGLTLSNSKVFKLSTLSRMANNENSAAQNVVIKPLIIKDRILEYILKYVGNRHLVESVYPATPLQSGMIARTLKDKTAYCNQTIWKISGGVEKEIFKKAISAVVEAHDILRTRFVSTSEGIFQVLQKKLDVEVQECTDLQRYCEDDMSKGFSLDDLIWFRVALVKEDMQFTHLIFTIHHVLYDGWCLDTITND